MVGQRVNDDHRIFASLNDFVEIANCAVAHRGSQRSIMPDGFFAFDQKAANQIG